MYEDYTQERIAKLRVIKGDSARDMSLSLGQNDTYINKIENKKALPSLQGLFYICEYLGITPRDFFDEDNPSPAKLDGIIDDLKALDDEALTHIAGVIREMRGKK
ncbi:helix-turn-helix domain-containing protein [Christensenellaceae bacterium OttesenSCG-928-K19]|nr:helix-turn-helix domain-containing protein [Christensenellaceae bacterium OttesenSCG-928-K19]